jgi:hypothetical protein
MSRLDRIAAERNKRSRLRQELAEMAGPMDEARRQLEAHIGFMKHALRWNSKSVR